MWIGTLGHLYDSESESEVTYDQVWWPILGICALHLTHPKCTHTAVNTHTPWTHTRSSGQPFMLRRPGSSWGFGALLKGTSVVVLRVERALDIHSPHLQYLPARDSNSQPFDYESDSLTIRPRLPRWVSHLFVYPTQFNQDSFKTSDSLKIETSECLYIQ